MKKIIFEDLPNTNTPINATNLNKLQENIEEEINKTNELNYISCGSDGTEPYTAYGWEDIPTTTEALKIGEKLTLENGVVKIGTGISYVKVSGFAIINVTNNNNSNAYEYMVNVRKNEDGVIHNRIGIGAGETQQTIFIIPETIISVTQGDIIKLSSYSTSGQLTRSIQVGARLNVEVIK